MARVPSVLRRTAVSQVAARPAQPGQGFAALANLASTAADFLEPAAERQAETLGKNSVYRDESGQLQVDEKHILSGKYGDIHNAAAYGKYLSQKTVDVQNTFNELRTQYQYDPSGFEAAATSYVQILREDENIPSVLKDDLVSQVEQQASQQFNGLYRAQVQRDEKAADVSSKTARDLLTDDYVSLVMSGDVEGAEAKLKEIEAITQYRQNAPFIGDTPPESEAFLRGARGTAKAARLSRELNDLAGATEITDEQRANLEAVLDDPDLAPDVRQRLYNATQGRLKGIEGRAAVKARTDSAYESKVIRVESGGRADAKAKTSSATGHHQFIKSTWLNLVSKHKPEWARGLNEQQILGLRKDPEKSSEIFQHFREGNQAVLARNGLAVNDATEYMAHFFGAGDAVKVLSAAPGTPIEQIVSAGKIKANSFLAGMTARDAYVWAGRKMTVKASDLAAVSVDVAQIEDPEVRASAAAALNHEITTRRALEQAEAEIFKERLVQGDNVTQQEILENHDLDTDMQIHLVNQLKGLQKGQDAVQQFNAALADTSVQFDPFNATTRTNLDKKFQADIGDGDPLAPGSVTTAEDLTARVGTAPKTAFNSIRAGIHSNDPAVVSAAVESAIRLDNASPTAFTGLGGAGEVERAISDYKTLAQTLSADEAGQRMIDARQEVPKNVSDRAKDLTKNLQVSDIIDHFDESAFGDPRFASEQQSDVALGEYKSIFSREFIATGDEEMARGRALQEIGRIYGVSSVTGSRTLMKYPPQNFYPPVRGSHDWMTSQLESEVSAFAFGDEAEKPSGLAGVLASGASLGGANKWVKNSSIILVPDARTRQDLSSSGKPSYQVYYMDEENSLQAVPGRYQFDPTEAQSASRDDFERERSQIDFQGSARSNFNRNAEKFGLDMALQMIREEENNAVPQ